MNQRGKPLAEAESIQIDGSLRISAAGGPIGEGLDARVQALAANRGRVGVAQGLVTTPRPGIRANSVAQSLTMQGVAPIIVVEPEATDLEITVFRSLPVGCPDWANARLATALDPVSPNRNPYPAQALPMGCHLDVALDAMVADPRDLTDPPARMSPAHAAALGLAMERYRTTGPRPLPALNSASDAL
jgi:hypothetical protein